MRRAHPSDQNFNIYDSILDGSPISDDGNGVVCKRSRMSEEFPAEFIMHPEQQPVLQILHSNGVYLEVMNNVTEYNSTLLILFVQTATQEGIPAAFMLCPRTNLASSIESFLREVKKQCCPFHFWPPYFMCNVNKEEVFNIYRRVFPDYKTSFLYSQLEVFREINSKVAEVVPPGTLAGYKLELRDVMFESNMKRAMNWWRKFRNDFRDPSDNFLFSFYLYLHNFEKIEYWVTAFRKTPMTPHKFNTDFRNIYKSFPERRKFQKCDSMDELRSCLLHVGLEYTERLKSGRFQRAIFY